MPETATLHIQARESDPIRVVELPGASVRIGRASFCDVRLPEPALAEEECQLRRRGATWHLVPVSETGALSIEGRVVDRPRPLPYGVPLRVGDFSLTLRPSAATPPQWNAPTAAAPPVPEAAGSYRAPGESGLGRTRAALAAREKQWEAKWKAAAEQLGGRAARPVVDRPASAERLAGWQSVDLPRREPAAVRTPTRPVETAAFPSLLTVTPPSAYRAARRAEPAAPPAEPAIIEDPVVFAPPVEPVIEDPIIFTPPAELDWTEAREPELAVPVVIEPVVEIEPQAVEAALEADTTLADEVTLEVPEVPQAADPTPESPPAASLSARVGQGLLALWARLAPQRPDNSSPIATTDGAGDPGSHAPHGNAVWDALHPHSSRELPPQSGEDGIPTQSVGTSSVDCAGAATTDDRLEPVEPTACLWEGEAPAEPTPQRGTAPEEPADGVAGPAPTERPAPRRRPVVRRRPKPAGRVPRLGNVRVVPREAPAEPAAPIPPPPTPEPDPFTGGTWQAHTGSWTGAHVTTGTWHASNGSSAHPDAAADAHQSWPSARDILAARVSRPAPQPKAPARPRPLPTDVSEPEHFTIPLWLGWLPLTAAAGFAAVAGVALAWTWSQDAKVAATVSNFLATSKAGDRFPLEPEALPTTAWWRSTGGTLARRAVALGRSEEAEPDEVRALLTVAAQASPLDVTARLALARLPQRDDDDSSPRVRGAGLARDVLALAWSGEQLAKAGQKDSALRAYRRALELAATAEVDRLGNPAYDDELEKRRYSLPGEELVGPVVHAMAGHTGWTLDDWTAALPSYALAPLLAARELREADRATSDALLDRVLGDEEARVPPAGASAAIHHAARAEAHALKSQWAEAEALYREAVVLMPSERIRRSWQVNLADLALRQNDDAARQRALDAANNHDPNDPITLRVVELQKLAGAGAGARTRDDAGGRAGHALAR